MMALIEFTEHAYGRLLGAVEGMTEEELLMLRFGAIVLMMYMLHVNRFEDYAVRHVDAFYKIADAQVAKK